MQLRPIPPGKFLMGSPRSDAGRRDDEEPHEVTLTRPFYLGAHHVTVGQFKEFVEKTKHETQAEKAGGFGWRDGGSFVLDPNVTWRNPGFKQTDDHPVVCVDWHDAKAFCDWLSQKEGHQYTLPTEAQWEYCCRAGSTTPFFFGSADPAEYAWYALNAERETHSVGQKKANAWGLYDMNGNAFQWTTDWYDKDYYRTSLPQDPPGPSSGQIRVLRGGSWVWEVTLCRAAFRKDLGPYACYVDIGFRVVRMR
jgi:formylglycine-generating enzyme required for sulfatase activity